MLIGDDTLAALVGDQVSIFSKSKSGSFEQVQVIGNNTVMISEIRASDTKLAVAFRRNDNTAATLELFHKSATDGKWTTEKIFSNSWSVWARPELVSPPIMFDLDGDRLVYLTGMIGQKNFLMVYPDDCWLPLSSGAFIGITVGSVALVGLIAVPFVVRARAMAAKRKTSKTAKEHRIEPAI